MNGRSLKQFNMSPAVGFSLSEFLGYVFKGKGLFALSFRLYLKIKVASITSSKTKNFFNKIHFQILC